jgi:proteasome lid subunit RPN8/RPN11
MTGTGAGARSERRARRGEGACGHPSLPVAAQTPRALVIAPRALHAALAHIAAERGREAVGLLAARAGRGRRAAWACAYLPLANRAADPARRFEVTAADMAQALSVARRRKLVAVAVVHSHPVGPARPSALDRLGAWPELAIVVVAGERAPRWRAYRASGEGEVRPLPLVVERRRGERPTTSPVGPRALGSARTPRRGCAHVGRGDLGGRT